MSKKKSFTLTAIICMNIFFILMTILFYVLWRKLGGGGIQAAYITFLTTSYHFVMRIAVGEIVTVIYSNRKFDLTSVGFRQLKFEPKLYKALRVKKWKKFSITAKPNQFDLEQNSAESLLHNMAMAELAHRIIMVLSFVPLILIIPYGTPAVFIITSVCACLIDLKYVIIQRYNRPRVLKLIKMTNNQIKKIKQAAR